MNAYGNPIVGGNLEDGGTVTGDLAITQDLTVSGDTTLQDFTATNGSVSGTLQVGTLVSDIKTEDTIIHLGVNNPADALNLGIIEEYENAGTRFAGLLRYFSDKKHYLIDNTQPIPTGLSNISLVPRSDFVCKDIDANLIIAANVGATSAVSSQEVKINNVGLATRYTIAHDTSPDTMILKNAVGTELLNINQSGSLNMLNNNIVDAGIIGAGSVNATDSLRTLELKLDDGVIQQWSIITNGTTKELEIKNQAGTVAMTLDQSAGLGLTNNFYTYAEGGLSIGTVNPYNFPISHNGLTGSFLTLTGNDLNFTRDAIMDSLTMVGDNREYNLEVSADNRLRLTNNNVADATYIEFLSSKIFQRQSFGSNEGVSNFAEASRGNLTTPTAILANDAMYRRNVLGYDGVAFLNSTQIFHYADENFSPTQRGSRIDFSTITNGTTSMVNRFTINDDVEIKNCKLNIGVSPNNYVFPSTSSGVADKSVLFFNSTTKNMEFESPIFYTLSYGGSAAAGDYLAPLGDPSLPVAPGLTNAKEFIIPQNSNIYTATYSTTSGDATTVMSLWVNGVSVVTGNLTAAQGVFTFSPKVSVSVGDRVAIRFDSGTNPGQGNVILICKN